MIAFEQNSFQESAAGPVEFSDVEFLKSLKWEGTLPKKLVAAVANGDIEAFVAARQKNLAKVAGRIELPKGEKNRATFWLSGWSIQAFESSGRLNELANLLHRDPIARKSHKAVSNGLTSQKPLSKKGWLKSLKEWAATRPEDDCFSPIELLIVLEILLRTGERLSPRLWWRLWRGALTSSLQLHANLDSAGEEQSSEDRLVVVRGELPWLAGLVFSNVQGVDVLTQAGRDFLTQRLDDKTDTDGTPHADLLDHLTYWLASLTRSVVWANAFRTDVWDDGTAERFREFVRIAAAMCRADGRMAFGKDDSPPIVEILTQAVRVAGWKLKSPPVLFVECLNETLRKRRAEKLPTIKSKFKEQHAPTAQSDWAHLACLRNNWTPLADSLVLTHDTTFSRLCLNAFGRPVIQGDWSVDIRVNDRPVELQSTWSCTCWFSDADADYVELQQNLADGVRVERQVLLSRTGHFAVLSDSVSADENARVDYEAHLPLANGIDFAADQLTREVVLEQGMGTHGNPARSRVFPVALPQHRVDGTPGRFTVDDAGLTLKHAALGGLFVPLVFDWERRRFAAFVDWQALTVTEENRILTSHSAVGYRLRIGNQQLVIYRSLNKGEVPRSVLGLHTASETVIGRFEPTGDITPILQVES